MSHKLVEGIVLATADRRDRYALDGIPATQSIRVWIAGRAIHRDASRENGFDLQVTGGKVWVVLADRCRPVAGDPVLIEYQHYRQ